MEKRVLNAEKSAEFLKEYLTIPDYEIVKNAKKISIKPPVMLKLLSKKAVHKTEFNAVKLAQYPESITPAFNDLMKEAKKHKLDVEGIMVQKFIKGVEAIIGIKKDQTFGHVIVFGVGGILTEIINDTVTRKCPITGFDAEEMIESLRLNKMFHEARGLKPNLDSLKEILVKISRIPKKHPEIEELDINPLILTEKKGYAADVRIVISKK